MLSDFEYSPNDVHAVLVISDIHSNLGALESAWHDASNVALISETWVLGDIVGYGPQPNEVVTYLRRLPRLTVVKGNHEAAALAEITTRAFNPVAADAAEWTKMALSDESALFLKPLPLTVELRDVTLCHGSPRDPLWEYILSTETAKQVLSHFDTSGCAVGHSHVPFVMGFNEGVPSLARSAFDGYGVVLAFDRWLINPGSIGQPRDGDPRASYAVLQFDARSSHPPFVSFHRADYDVQRTQRLIEAAGLPPYLGYRLAEGR